MLDLSSPTTMGQHKTRREIVTDLNELRARCLAGINSRVERFTPKVLKAICPAADGKKDVFVGTLEQSCVYVRTSPAGHASYCVQHRTVGRVTIGDIRRWTISEAIARAREILRAATLGRNLIAEEVVEARRQRAEKTVGQLIEWYLAEPDIRKLRSSAEKARYLRIVWKPLHEYSAERIERSDILPELKKTAKERGNPTANAAKTALGAMFTYALQHDELKREYLPTNNLPTWKMEARKRYFSREELPLWWCTGAKVHPALGDQNQLLVLTGCRRQEIAGLRNCEVNLSENQLELPGWRVKNGLDHVVPLVPAARAIIERWYPSTRSKDRLFPVLKNQYDQELHELLDKEAERHRLEHKLDKPALFQPLVETDQGGQLIRNERWVVEDSRRTFSTGLREWLRPVPDEALIDLLLNHIRGATGAKVGHRGTYNRALRLDDRRAVLERWSRFILNLVGESEPAKVVNIR
jgi:integrase